MSSTELSELLSFAVESARLAGDRASEMRRSQDFEVRFKVGVDLVTSADLAAEKIIIDRIKERFPGHRILSEEASPRLDDPALFEGDLWIIDPIDGTTNFARNHHQVAVSIAYARAGEVQVGVVHAPFQGETFSAAKGNGATMNGAPIRVSGQTELKHSLVATGFPASRRTELDLKVKRVRAILERCRDLRRLGAAALDLCWVANGRLDAYFESVNPWDMAAGRLIALEAGARAGFIGPRPADSSSIPESLYGEEMLVTTPAIFDAMEQLLRP